MNRWSRRAFLEAAVAGAALGSSGLPLAAVPAKAPPGPLPVHFNGDGLALSTRDYASLLAKLAADGEATRDNYMAGGAVETLETRFARVLGKERAVFVATGTLANHLAIRRLARGRSRVLVQAESHIYCDSLDSVQTLSHLNLVPLAAGQATFTLAQVEEACGRASEKPFPVPVGAISIECPVRRRDGEAFDYEEMKRIAGYAREHGISMHLDGARLFVASAYTGIAPAEYAALFDTVYVSLYKNFNAASGAILAGPADQIEPIARDRKIFGSGLAQAWPFAAVALHFLEGFPERFQTAVAASRELFALLEQHPRFRVESLPRGTAIHKLHVKDADLEQYRAALAARGMRVPAPRPGQPFLSLVVNESLNAMPAAEVAKVFVDAL